MNLAKPLPFTQTHGRRPSVRRMGRAEEAECVRQAQAMLTLTPSMSRKEKAECIRLAHEAQTRLLRQYEKLVYKIASYYHRKRIGSDLEDLAQGGRMGVLYAIGKFDLSRGVLFITYASNWIRSFVEREDCGGPIYVPRCACKNPKNAAKAAAARNVLTIGNGSDFALDDQWPDPKAADLLAVDRPEYDDLDAVRKAMSGLKDKRMRLVLEGRFIDGKTLQQVGDELGVSKERIRQIQVSAMEMLRRAMGRRRRKAARPTLLPGPIIPYHRKE